MGSITVPLFIVESGCKILSIFADIPFDRKMYRKESKAGYWAALTLQTKGVSDKYNKG